MDEEQKRRKRLDFLGKILDLFGFVCIIPYWKVVVNFNLERRR